MRPTPIFRLIAGLSIILAAASSNAAEPIRIATIFAHSGVAASANFHALRGVRFAVQECNHKGGLLGRKIELIEIDNRSTPIGSKVAADRAVAQGVTAIIGASWSSHSLAVARVAQKNGVPMITPDSTNAEVTRVGDYIFRACFIDPFQGWVMARFAWEDLNARTAIVFINVASDYSMGLADTFRDHFSAMGGTILKQIRYEHKQNSYRAEASAASGITADVLYIPGHDNESARLLEATRQEGIPGIPIGTDGWSTDSFFQQGGRWVPHGYYCAHWSPNLTSAQSLKFVAVYDTPDTKLSTEPLGYDAMNLLANAIRRAGSTNRQHIRDALAQTTDFAGVSGRISFDSHGDPVKPAVIMEIVNGQPRFLKQIAP